MTIKNEITVTETANNSSIHTIPEEIQAHGFIQGILSLKVEPSRITIRDARTYCAVLLDDNNRKTLCRLYLESAKKKIEFPKKVISIDVSSEILEKYSHEYSSNELPIAIKFFVEDGTFMAQGTGQSAFPLTAISTTEFEFAPAKIRINFNENGSEMKLIQNGKTFNFNKK